MNQAVKNILDSGSPTAIKALFLFDGKTSEKMIRLKFLYWSRYFFPQFFGNSDAPFHRRMDEGNIGIYMGREKSFLNIGFRDSSKTTRTKLFVAFAIANDETHRRKYFKILSKDIGNAKQTTTDVYNMLISRRIRALYPEIFQKTEAKREETMAAFTTSTGVKMIGDSILPDQRGQIQDESRPDFLWFDDIETRISLMSAVITHKIWANMDEAITGLAKDGGAVFTANYISERGNVHKLVQKIENKLIVPIEENGVPMWNRFTLEDIARIKKTVEDYEGDYLCKPSASRDVYFDRESVERQVPKQPIDEVAGLKIYRSYDPMHRIASGHDVAGGVGLDSSTSVFIDFDTLPMQVIATYANNEIRPDAFAHELARQGKRFGENYMGVENNFGSTIDILKGIYPTAKLHKAYKNDIKIVFQHPTEYGWKTTSASKPKMIAEFAKAVEDGIIELNDPSLIAECRSFTLGDLMDKEVDPRLTTRHFDLLMAASIALQMNPHVKKPVEKEPYDHWNARKAANAPPVKNPAR